MAGQKMYSAKRRRFINNSIVHVVLGVLAVIWVFPIVWVILTSFRAEKGSYVSTFFPQSFTLDNYVKLFTDTSILNFPQMFVNHADHRRLLLYPFHLLRAGGLLLPVKAEV